MPDRLYVYQGGEYGAVDYNGLSASFETTSFIESGILLTEASIVGNTWRYVNKDGSPDRRFNGNHQIPIVQYGVVTLKITSGLNYLFFVSSVARAQAFVQGILSSLTRPQPYSGSRPQQGRSGANAGGPSQGQRQQGNSPPRPRQDQQQQKARSETRSSTNPLQSHSTANCYLVLKLSEDCTKEMAETRYN